MSRLMICTIGLLVLLPFSSAVALTSTITCHCFTDRSYDPSRPTLADPYFLATTQNSFFAALFKVDKKTIVMKKQGGSPADDLWVAYWVASKSGSTGDALLAARGRAGSWKEVIETLGIPGKKLGERFAAEVTAGASSAQLAQAIVDGVLLHSRLLGELELAVLRKEWASNQEVIIAVLIAAKARKPVVQSYRDVKRGGTSWGALLGEAKIQTTGIQAEFEKLLK